MIEPTTPAEQGTPAERGTAAEPIADPQREAETGGTGGKAPRTVLSNPARETPGEKTPGDDARAISERIESRTRTDNKLGTLARLREFRYRGLPVVFLMRPDGTVEPCPFLMSIGDVTAFFRLADSGTRHPRKTIERYRTMGLESVRVGRRTWFRLDDVLRFLDQQQERLEAS